MNYQERTLALAEDRPVPLLYGSSDVRPVKLEDFKRAHDQVNLVPFSFSFFPLFCRIIYSAADLVLIRW